MGGSSSKESEVINQVAPDADEQQKVVLLERLEKQVQELREEIKEIPPSFTDEIKETVSMEEDVMLLRYADLKDKSIIQRNIQDIFSKHPILEFIMETAKSMISSMSTTQEMTDAMRWNNRKLVKRVGNKIFGLEAHFKVQLLEKKESHNLGLTSSRDTILIVAYKCRAHSIEGDPESFPDEQDMKHLKF